MVGFTTVAVRLSSDESLFIQGYVRDWDVRDVFGRRVSVGVAVECMVKCWIEEQLKGGGGSEK